MNKLVTITAKFYDASGKPYPKLQVKSRYQGSARENPEETDKDGFFTFQASSNRTVEILAKLSNTKDYQVFRIINSSIKSSLDNPISIKLPKPGLVTTLFKVIDSQGKAMTNFPVKTRPKGGRDFERLTDEQGFIQIQSSPNRDIEFLVLTSADKFILKKSLNSGNGSQETILVQLDEPYKMFVSKSNIQIIDRAGNDYIVENTKVEIFYLESGRKEIVNTSNGKLSISSMIGEKLKITVFKPNSESLTPKNHSTKYINNNSIKLKLDVDITHGNTDKGNPNIDKILKVGKCLCNRDMTLDELQKMILEMRKSEGVKTSKIFNHKNCTLKDKSIEMLLYTLNATFKKYEINSCLRKINFMGQIYWEAARFITTTEFASGTYLNPGSHKSATKNGNIEQGDGPRYKGRGFMQLTWRNNYKRYFEFVLKNRNNYSSVIGNDLTITDLMDRRNKYSDLVASNNLLAMDSAGWFWLYGTNLDLNIESDKNNVSTISKKVNGGGNGKNERKEYNSRLLKIMNYSQCVNRVSNIG